MSVMLGYVHSDMLDYRFHNCLLETLVHDGKTSQHLRGVAARYSNGPISGARNQVVTQFLDTDCEWLWFVDSDATWHPTMLSRLLASADPQERPIVGALCHMVRDVTGDDGLIETDEWGNARREIVPTMYQRVLDDDGRWQGYREIESYTRGLVEVDATGCHCVLIHRGVFEKIQNDHPNRWFRESEVAPGVPAGEDITFMLQARDLDIPVIVDTRVESGHVKPWVLTSLMATVPRESR